MLSRRRCPAGVVGRGAASHAAAANAAAPVERPRHAAVKTPPKASAVETHMRTHLHRIGERPAWTRNPAAPSQAQATWESQVAAHIARFKRYPPPPCGVARRVS